MEEIETTHHQEILGVYHSESLAVASFIINKVLARTESETHLLELYDQAFDYVCDFALAQMVSETLAKTHLHWHDREHIISDDCDEPTPAPLDSNGTFHLAVRRQTYIQKVSEKEIGLTPHAFTHKAPSSVMSITKKFQQRGIKHLTDRGDDILPKPLITNQGAEEDRVIVNFRKKKEREELLKMEEIKKKMELEERMKAIDQNNNQKNNKQLEKKVFTYDDKGDIIFVKSVKPDILPEAVLNLPYKLKLIRGKHEQGRTDTQEVENQPKQNDANQSRNRVQNELIPKINLPLINNESYKIYQQNNEIVPMGSVFEETEPNLGITLYENGKQKFGPQHMSKRQEGQMSLEEYKSQKEIMNVIHEQRSLRFQTASLRNDSALTIIDQKSLRKDLMPINLMGTNTFYWSKDMGASISLYKSGFSTSRLSQDRMIRKREGVNDLLTDHTLLVDEGFQTQRSYVEPLQTHKRQVSFGFSKHYRDDKSSFLPALGLSKAGNTFYPSSSRTYQPETEEASVFGQKNVQILSERRWGDLEHQASKIPKQIEKKPELKKSKSQLFLSAKRKGMKVNQIREHLPPPPLGKTLGHGISHRNIWTMSQIKLQL